MNEGVQKVRCFMSFSPASAKKNEDRGNSLQLCGNSAAEILPQQSCVPAPVLASRL
jgi:hypothetical protein